MKIYTQDDVPVAQSGLNQDSLLYIKFYDKNQKRNIYTFCYYDFYQKKWKWLSGKEIIDLKFQWVYPDEVFKEKKV